MVTMIALIVNAYLLPGIIVEGFWPVLATAVTLGIMNMFVKPLMVFLTLPITVISLGLFLLIINGIILYLASIIVSGFYVANMFSAVIAAFVISTIKCILN